MGAIREIIATTIANERPPVSSKRRGPKSRSGSPYQISRGTGIQQSTLSRFLSGKQGMNIETLERLCDYLGLELVPKINVLPPRKIELERK